MTQFTCASRYQRGSRSLAENLQANALSSGNQSDVAMETDEEEYDIPDEMEDIIGQYTSCLLHTRRN